MKKLLLLTFAVLLSVQLFAQNILATGVVKDANGNIIVGAAVTEKGTTNSTLSFMDGTFQLQLVSGYEITITMSGYEKQTIEVGPDGKIPDIILQKNIKRVNVGLKGGLDYVIPYYKMTGGHGTDLEPTHGVNAGFYMDINLSRTFAFEFGAQLFYKNLEYKNDDVNVRITSLHIPIACCKWRPGDKKKQFIILLGHGVELTLQKEILVNGSTYKDTDDFSNIMYALHFGFGYELKCGLGFLATAKLNFPFKEKNDITEEYYSVGGALTYRFGKR